MQFGKGLAVVGLGLAVGWTSSVEAQTPGPVAAPRRIAQSTGSKSDSGFWQGQVRSFKQRWGMAPQTRQVTTTQRPVHRPGVPSAAAANVQFATYSQPAYHRQVRPVAHHDLDTPIGPAIPSSPSRSAAGAQQGPQTTNAGMAGLSPGYPQFEGPLYPCPLPGIPDEIGGAVITNQAFAPHEMLYPHEYRALYPPFYYKVSGGWMVTPWGVWSSDRWELQGTEVKVKYKSHISPLTGFMPPVNIWDDQHWKKWN